MLNAVTRLRLFYLLYLSKPASDRVVYRTIRRRRPRRIVELGIGLGQRAKRMIELASLETPVNTIHYTGIDTFEDRTAEAEPGLPLKAAYQILHGTGARVRLVPGDPFSALVRSANHLGAADLVVISSRLDPQSLQRAWLYLPRLLGPDSLVLVEESSGAQTRMRLLSAQEIKERSRQAKGRCAA